MTQTNAAVAVVSLDSLEAAIDEIAALQLQAKALERDLDSRKAALRSMLCAACLDGASSPSGHSVTLSDVTTSRIDAKKAAATLDPDTLNAISVVSVTTRMVVR